MSSSAGIFPLADVITFRRDSKERHIEHLKNKRAEHQRRMAVEAQEIRWIEIELESLGVPRSSYV